ncbi:hypothetical protein FACS1894130_09820 [Spirochaetia bacterium]|nr:hypothetical protein FACS1894130_09820 [Spirochaetia bacterium]
MKRGIFLFIVGITVIAGAAAQTAQGTIMYVATKNAELKSSTGFFAETVAVLQYGEQVTLLRENSKWMEVRLVNRTTLTGWLLANSLTSKRIVSGTAASASADELALAGKGFSAEIETAYKRNTPVNYVEIDAMEAQGVSNQDLYDFLIQGHLKTGDN